MAEPRDACHNITLPSGEPIRVRGAGEMSPEAVAALGVVVDAARWLHAAEHPEDPAATVLWARVDAVRARRGITLRDVAGECGVRFSTLFRIGQGHMPNRDALDAIEHWLAGGAATMSRWCATESFPFEQFDPDNGDAIPVDVPGHEVCAGKRWHETWDPQHNAGTDEAESWACACPCHHPKET